MSSSSAERRALERERSLLALLAAAAAHAALFGLSPHVRAPAVPVVAELVRPIEVDISSWETFADSATTGAPRAAAKTEAVREERSLARVVASVATKQARTASASELPIPDGIGGDDGDGASEADRETPSEESAAPSHRIDIWRNGAAERVALLAALGAEPRDTPQPSVKPSIGLLREGLAESDTLTGASRSSAAVAAAYEVAQQHAPATGIAVFEVQTDSTGLVQHVRLLSAGSDDESWSRMGDGLKALLAQRNLRVPPGSKGLLTRLRVERGELAVSPSERHRTKRKAALGQAPLHPKEEWNESTRESLEPGHLSPSLGIVVSGASKAQPTRVVILSEQSL